jgi:hypothetical protein
MTGSDEIILCDNKAKNAGIAIDTVRLFNEVSVQKNESKWAGYFITIPWHLLRNYFWTKKKRKRNNFYRLF